MAPGKQLREFCGWCLLLSYADIKLYEYLAGPKAVPLSLFQDVVPSSPADASTSVARLFPAFERLKCMKSRLECTREQIPRLRIGNF